MGWTRRSVAATVLDAMEDYRRDVGRRIRQLREARELTQEELADLVGVRAKTISRWENGRNEALRENGRKVAAALKVDPEEILGQPPAPLGLGETAQGGEQLDRIEEKLDRILTLLEAHGLERELADAADPPPHQHEPRSSGSAAA